VILHEVIPGLLQDQYSVSNSDGFIDVVGNQDCGEAKFVNNRSKPDLKAFPGVDIHGGERLVQ
jgi:hypothetical protein